MPDKLGALLRVIRCVTGMPDYTAYVEHLRQCHPDQPIPSEREFYESYLQSRYGDAPTRCC
jgi:uncharacterized short protein YbdD (DUF466 family)